VSEDIGYYSEYDNVEDFIEHFMLRMAERYAKHGRHEVSDAIYDALDQYLARQVGIQIIDGEVYVVSLDITEETDNEDVNDT
tara:strand:- start:81 stop:326 length:246 start_codon:yes stop_codon:yes gene_type:complete